MGTSDGPDAEVHLNAGYQFTPWLFTMQSTRAQDLHVGHLVFTSSQNQMSCVLCSQHVLVWSLSLYHPPNTVCDKLSFI